MTVVNNLSLMGYDGIDIELGPSAVAPLYSSDLNQVQALLLSTYEDALPTEYVHRLFVCLSVCLFAERMAIQEL